MFVDGYHGPDTSFAIKESFARIASTRAISLSFDREQPSEESAVAIRETEEMVRSGKGKSYESGSDLIRAALSE